MRLQDQASARLSSRAMDADHDRRLRVRFRKSRSAGMTRDRVAIHLEALHGEAVLAIGPEHEILHGVLGAALRGRTDQRLGEFDLLDEPLTHRAQDAVAQAGLDAHEGSSGKVEEGPARPRQYKASRGESNATQALPPAAATCYAGANTIRRMT